MKKQNDVKGKQAEGMSDISQENVSLSFSSASSRRTGNVEAGLNVVPGSGHFEWYGTFFKQMQHCSSSNSQTFRGPDLDLDVIEVYSMIFTRYVNHFGSREKIPFHRDLDLLSLQGLLQRDEITHVELYDEMQKIIDKMMTGLIYGEKVLRATGNSRLKSFLKMSMSHPMYNREAMEARDKRRQRLREKYATMQNALNGQTLNVFEVLDLRNQSLEKNCNEYQQKLNEKNQRIAELLAQIKLLTTLSTDTAATTSDFAEEKKGSEILRDEVTDLNAENRRLRLQQFRDTHSAYPSHPEAMPVNEGKTSEDPKESSFVDSISNFFSSFFN